MVGWAVLYLLAVAGSMPDFKSPWGLLDDTIAIAVMFLGSCVLRPICRALVRRSLSWFPFEVRAFVWSVVVGTAGAGLSEVAISGFAKVEWVYLTANCVQSAVVLFLWCSLYFSVKQWQQATRERQRLLRAESEARAARLSALRYQLNPHFLFNSLNAVSTLVLEGNAPAATRMLAQIGELLRTTLDGEARAEIPFSEEIALTGQYLAIEQIRLGDRLKLAVAIAPDTLDALVPSMLLQPLVENAVRHGIAPLIEGGTIQIESMLHGDRIEIRIRNSGPPADSARQKSGSGSGLGLSNTAERLRALYGADHEFLLQWPQAGGCEITLALPFRKSAQEQEVAACAR